MNIRFEILRFNALECGETFRFETSPSDSVMLKLTPKSYASLGIPFTIWTEDDFPDTDDYQHLTVIRIHSTLTVQSSVDIRPVYVATEANISHKRIADSDVMLYESYEGDNA